ncbi:hypothetical protein LCGC14_3036370, partial [marine sediment metagenome]
AIACVGVSGLLLAPMVALILKKHLAVIRKPSDLKEGVNHSQWAVETSMDSDERWLFLDDLIASGNTLHMVRDTMQKMGHPKEAATYLYCVDDYRKTGDEFNYWESDREQITATDVGNPA